jgi:hypothetical protein
MVAGFVDLHGVYATAINERECQNSGIENPRVGGSIPPQATKYNRMKSISCGFFISEPFA